MKINSEISWGGNIYKVEYEDTDSFEKIGKFDQIYGICFVGNKIAVCYNKLGFWVLPGGTPKNGESMEETLKREVFEEAGLKLIKYLPVGYQISRGNNKTKIQLRAVCECKLAGKPADPCGDITKMKLIALKDIKEYIDWGKIGDRVFQRSEELKKQFYVN